MTVEELKKESVLDRVQKILNLANGTNHQGEAENALLKAQALLLENGLSMSDVEERSEKNQPKTENVEEESLSTKTGGLADWKVAVASIIAKNCRCVSMSMLGKGKRKHLNIIGLASEVKVAIHMINFAWGAGEHLASDFLKKNPAPEHQYHNQASLASYRLSQRNSFLLGYVYGIQDKFRQQVECKDLVIVRSPKVDEFIQEKHPNSVSGKGLAISRNRHSGAISAGFAAGKSVDPNTLK